MEPTTLAIILIALVIVFGLIYWAVHKGWISFDAVADVFEDILDD